MRGSPAGNPNAMRIVIVGATGNVGTSLVESLVEDRRVDSIVAIERRVPTEWQPARTEFRAADITRDNLVPVFAGADAVVHLAWLMQPTRKPEYLWHVNVEGSQRVFDAVAAAEVPTLVYASSIGAYSPAPNQWVDESWPTHGFPGAGYSREKAYVERLLDTFEARHPDRRVVRMRPAFIFKRQSASEQRRLMGGPLLPGKVMQPGRLPVLPVPNGLKLQAVHSSDAALAYRLALLTDVRGAFNIAAEPVIDAEILGQVFEARPVPMPALGARTFMMAAWRAHLSPTDPALLDLVLQLPMLDSTRAHRELGWQPQYSGVDALRELLGGMGDGAGMQTPPLEPDSPAKRIEEVVGPS